MKLKNKKAKKRYLKSVIFKILKCYLNLFLYSLQPYFLTAEFTRLPTSYFFITTPYRQLCLQLIYLPSSYHVAISAGQLLKWSFNQGKFYKKTVRSITAVVLLLWNYFLPALSENIVVCIKNFTFFVNTFVTQFLDIVEVVPLSIVVKHPYRLTFRTTRRIKKRVFKQLKHL